MSPLKNNILQIIATLPQPFMAVEVRRAYRAEFGDHETLSSCVFNILTGLLKSKQVTRNSRQKRKFHYQRTHRFGLGRDRRTPGEKAWDAFKAEHEIHRVTGEV